MTKKYYDNEYVTINSVLKIEFAGKQIIIEHQIDSTEFNDEDSSIFLCFNPKETKSLFKYYKTDCVEVLTDSIHQHFTTYYSLKRYQDFFNNRGIHSTLSLGCAFTD